LDEVAKGWTCHQQAELFKGTEHFLVVGFLEYPFKSWNINVVLENEERLCCKEGLNPIRKRNKPLNKIGGRICLPVLNLASQRAYSSFR